MNKYCIIAHLLPCYYVFLPELAKKLSSFLSLVVHKGR